MCFTSTPSLKVHILVFKKKNDCMVFGKGEIIFINFQHVFNENFYVTFVSWLEQSSNVKGITRDGRQPLL